MNPMNTQVQNEPLYNQNIPRIEKGFELMKEVEIIGDMAYVKSQSNPKKIYEVNYKHGDCNCPDNQFRMITCKHLRAVKSFLERTK